MVPQVPITVKLFKFITQMMRLSGSRWVLSLSSSIQRVQMSDIGELDSKLATFLQGCRSLETGNDVTNVNDWIMLLLRSPVGLEVVLAVIQQNYYDYPTYISVSCLAAILKDQTLLVLSTQQYNCIKKVIYYLQSSFISC